MEYRHPHQYKLLQAHIVHRHDTNTRPYSHSLSHTYMHTHAHTSERIRKLLQITASVHVMLCFTSTLNRIICELSVCQCVHLCTTFSWSASSRPYVCVWVCVPQTMNTNRIRMNILQLLGWYPWFDFWNRFGSQLAQHWAVRNTMYTLALPSFELNYKIHTGRDAWISLNKLQCFF